MIRRLESGPTAIAIRSVARCGHARQASQMHRHAQEARGLTQVQLSTQIPFSADAVWDWHQRPGAFERLSPPWRPVEVLETGSGVALGEGKTLRMAAGP